MPDVNHEAPVAPVALPGEPMVASISSKTWCGRRSTAVWWRALAPLALLAALPGCQGDSFHFPESIAFWQKPEPKIDYTTPEDAIVLTGGEIRPDQTVHALGGDFQGAMRLFGAKDYANAEPIFGHIADN